MLHIWKDTEISLGSLVHHEFHHLVTDMYKLIQSARSTHMFFTYQKEEKVTYVLK